MSNMNKIKTGLLTTAVLSAMFMASEASALACVNGASNNATITFINLAGQGLDSVGNIFINKFYTDNQFKYPTGTITPLILGKNTKCQDPISSSGVVRATPAVTNQLCNDSPTNSGGTTNADYVATANDVSKSAAAYTKTLPVVCSLALPPNPYQNSADPSASNKLTNILYTSGTTVNVGTTIGLAGAYKVRATAASGNINSGGTNFDNTNIRAKSLRWGKLYLYKSAAATWQLKDEYGILFEIPGANDVVSGTGASRKVTVSGGNLKFGTLSTSLGQFLQSGGLLTNNAATPAGAFNNNLGTITSTVFF